MILFLIAVSTVILAMDSPLIDPEGKKAKVLFYMDIAVTSVFILEVVLKSIAFGFLFSGSKSYLRNHWNVLDFLIILLSVSCPQ